MKGVVPSAFAETLVVAGARLAKVYRDTRSLLFTRSSATVYRGVCFLALFTFRCTSAALQRCRRAKYRALKSSAMRITCFLFSKYHATSARVRR